MTPKLKIKAPHEAANQKSSKTAMSPAHKKQKRGPPSFADSGTLVTFLISPEDPQIGKTASFICHKEFACYASPVLDAAFDGQFIEGQTQTYKLEDTTPRAFRFWMQWVYQGKFILRHNVPVDEQSAQKLALAPYYESEDDAGANYNAVETSALAEAWVLADKLAMPKLQNCIMEVLCDKVLENWISGHYMALALHYIYDNTADDSPLKRLFVFVIGRELGQDDLTSRGLASEWFVKGDAHYPRQALIDLLLFRTVHGCECETYLELVFSDFEVPIVES